MRKPGCAECERLWEEYGAATFAHVILDNRVKIAELCREVTVALNSEYQDATQKREDAQRRLKEHEATHGESGASGMA